MGMQANAEPLLEVRGLKKYFPVEGGLLKRVVGHVQAVDGIDFTVQPGESFGIVGESGCGKTTLGRAILRLIEPSDGRILIRNANGSEYTDVMGLSKRGLGAFRTQAQMIFQDPQASLNSRMTIGELIREPLVIHDRLGNDRGEQRVNELMRLVGLRPEMRSRFPHEVSGGQRQRIGIARALALDPQLVICDEAVSALDVSVRAQILNLLTELQQRLHLTYLFISHDLSVVRHFCHRVAVLYLGRIVELAPTERLFAHPQHPYTMALLSAIPKPGVRRHEGRILLSGDIPSPSDPPPGCRFHTRCWAAQQRCRTDTPPLVPMDDDPEHLVACHFTGRIPPWSSEFTELRVNDT